MGDEAHIASPLVQRVIKESITHLENFDGVNISWISFSDIVGEKFDLTACNDQALRNLQTAEFANTVGGWIETVKPGLGPNFKAAYQNVQDFDRTGLNNALYLCESLFQKIAGFTNVGDLFCFPTTPTISPKKGSLSSLDSVMAFYGRTMAISSFAGVGRLPEISIPAAHIDGIPVGVSLAAGNYQDEQNRFSILFIMQNVFFNHILYNSLYLYPIKKNLLNKIIYVDIIKNLLYIKVHYDEFYY